jgi:hypothetical protein
LRWRSLGWLGGKCPGDVEDHCVGHALGSRDWWPVAAVPGLALAPTRKETPMTAEDDFLGIVDKVLIEIEDIKGQVPRIISEQTNDSATRARNFEIRLLTEEEKKNSWILWTPKVSSG